VVTIAYSGNYTKDVTGVPDYITGAYVCINDDQGNCEELTEISRGTYATRKDGIRGVIGRSYYIEIRPHIGNTYRSIPETILPPPPIQRMYYQYNPGTIFKKNGFDVYIEFKDPVEEKNYYKWETIGWYQYSLDCWKKVYDPSPFNLISDKRFNGQHVTGVYLVTAPYNSRMPYVVDGYQLALTSSAYEFLENLKKQVSITGSIFDPPPTFIRGNIYNVDNPDNIALGYFYSAGAAEQGIAIDRTQVIESPENYITLLPKPLYCGDPCDMNCVIFGGGTCGTEPCPPECNNLPDMSYIPPDAWPLFYKRCDE